MRRVQERCVCVCVCIVRMHVHVHVHFNKSSGMLKEKVSYKKCE